MGLDAEYLSWLEDLFSPVPDTSIKKMFGGAGIFRRGLMYGLASRDGRISLKADDENRDDFIKEGCEEWCHHRKDGKIIKMGYWNIPERLTDGNDELVEWSEKAFEAAVRIDQKKPPGQRKLK